MYTYWHRNSNLSVVFQMQTLVTVVFIGNTSLCNCQSRPFSSGFAVAVCNFCVVTRVHVPTLPPRAPRFSPGVLFYRPPEKLEVLVNVTRRRNEGTGPKEGITQGYNCFVRWDHTSRLSFSSSRIDLACLHGFVLLARHPGHYGLQRHRGRRQSQFQNILRHPYARCFRPPCAL